MVKKIYFYKFFVSQLLTSVVLIVFVTMCLTSCSNSSKGGGGGGGGGKNSFVPRKTGGEGEEGGGTPPVSHTGMSCSNAQHTACVDFIGAGWTPQLMQQLCNQVGGQMANAVCSNDNQIAYCHINRVHERETVIHYYTPVTHEVAAQDCTDGGGVLN